MEERCEVISDVDGVSHTEDYVLPRDNLPDN